MVKFKRTVLVCVLLIASSLAQRPTTFHPGFNFFSKTAGHPARARVSGTGAQADADGEGSSSE